jgi:hypothetical protein
MLLYAPLRYAALRYATLLYSTLLYATLLYSTLLYSTIFIYLFSCSVLIYIEHQHAVYSLDEHLKRRYSLPIA